MFYPGILYSDSHPRWELAKAISEGGLFHSYPYLSDHHPTIPSLLMSFFYGLTGEVGFYIFIQAFFFSISFFLLANEFKKDVLTNVLIAIVLVLPVNSVYAIFHSFDSVGAIGLALLSLAFIRIYKKKPHGVVVLIIAFFLLTSHRINSVLLLPVLIGLLIWVSTIKGGVNRKRIIPISIALTVVACMPFIVPRLMGLHKANASVVGWCFEYSNLATLSKYPVHKDFLDKIDIALDDLRMEHDSKYHSEYSSSSHKILGKVKFDDALSAELTQLYFRMIYKEPVLFFTEKLKYLKYSWGLASPLWNTEIGKWQDIPSWQPIFTDKYAFVPNEKKNKFIRTYFNFSSNWLFLFRPLLLFINLFSVLLVVINFRKRLTINKQLIVSILLVYSLAFLYYATFAINSPGAHFRYFFPSLFVLQVLFIVILPSVSSAALRFIRTGNSGYQLTKILKSN